MLNNNEERCTNCGQLLTDEAREYLDKVGGLLAKSPEELEAEEVARQQEVDKLAEHKAQQMLKEQEKSPEELEAEEVARQQEVDKLAEHKAQQMLKEQEKSPEELESEKQAIEESLILQEQIGIDKGRKLSQEELALKDEEIRKLKDQNRVHDAELAKLRSKSNTQADSTEMKGNLQHNTVSNFLRKTFPGDIFKDFSIGESGSDILQTVMKNNQECGNILWESKRLEPNKSFNQTKFIPKLLDEKKEHEASVAVFVTNKFPVGKDKASGVELKPNQVCEIESHGFFYCPMDEERVGLLASTLRANVIANSQDLVENKTEKDKIYNLFIGPKFKAIADIVNRKCDLRHKEERKMRQQHKTIIASADNMLEAHYAATRIDREIMDEQNGLMNEVRLITGHEPLKLSFKKDIEDKISMLK